MQSEGCENGIDMGGSDNFISIGFFFVLKVFKLNDKIVFFFFLNRFFY